MRRLLLCISASALFTGVILCMFFLAREKEHEVAFVYQIGDGTLSVDSSEEWTRNVVRDKVHGYFSIWKSDSFNMDVAENCISKKGLPKEEKSAILDVLSLKRLRADAPTHSCAVRCSLSLCASGRIASRLSCIADACMEGFAKTLSESNVLALDRAAYREYQEKFSRERRIKELERMALVDADKQLTAEISSERERIAELEKTISEIGTAVDKRRGERLVRITE